EKTAGPLSNPSNILNILFGSGNLNKPATGYD
ncbi:unnamed protein product, partial [marine sediment metagenome]